MPFIHPEDQLKDELDRLWGKMGVPAIVLPDGRACRMQVLMRCLLKAFSNLESASFGHQTQEEILAALRELPSP